MLPSRRLLESNWDESTPALSRCSEFLLRWAWNQEFILKVSMTTTFCYWKGIRSGASMSVSESRIAMMRMLLDLRRREQ